MPKQHSSQSVGLDRFRRSEAGRRRCSFGNRSFPASWPGCSMEPRF